LTTQDLFSFRGSELASPSLSSPHGQGCSVSGSLIELRRRLRNSEFSPPSPTLSADGKALNYFEVAAFALQLTPAAIAEAAKSLTPKSDA